MYTKITRSGGRQYLQLVEGYRNEQGKVRHRVVANLGRLEDLRAPWTLFAVRRLSAINMLIDCRQTPLVRGANAYPRTFSMRRA